MSQTRFQPNAILRHQHVGNFAETFSLSTIGARQLPDEIRAERGRRLVISEIPSRFVCSVIGTCLNSGDIPKLISKYADGDVGALSDHELHGVAVTMATSEGPAARAIQKALDRRHERYVNQFAGAKTDASVSALWSEIWTEGGIAGAYWAVMSHPHCSPDLKQRIFGEVHMLSHQVGAVNRADLRRLAELKARTSELEAELQTMRLRHMEKLAQREEEIQKLESRLSRHEAELRQAQQLSSHYNPDAADEIESLRAALAIETQRRNEAEAALGEANASRKAAVQAFSKLLESESELRHELTTLENSIQRKSDAEAELLPEVIETIEGKTLLYVGGRPGTAQQIRSLVDRAGGSFLHHDGGIEERTGALAGLISQADLVLFPVDCVSHTAVAAVKRMAAQQGKPYVPLRTSGTGSFIGAMASRRGTAQSDL